MLTYGLAAIQLAVRAACSARIYGWRFAAAAPLRVAWGNVVNFVATVEAVRQFAAARARGRSMAWRKTDHVYPRPRLGELLVRMGTISAGDVEAVAVALPRGMRLGEYLVQSGRLPEESLYAALSLQSGIPAAPLHGSDVDRPVTRAFPADMSRQWQVLPFRVEQGRLHVATPDVPSPELQRELAGLSGLEIRYRLVAPAQFKELDREYLAGRR